VPPGDVPRSLDVTSDTSDEETEEALARLTAKYGKKA